jgi:TPR repeat protein
MASSAYLLGMLLAHRATGPEDPLASDAVTWLRRAASVGYPSAPDALASLSQAMGDAAEAKRWRREADAVDTELERAAKAGDPGAAGLLGDLFHARGDGRKADKWWRKANELAARQRSAKAVPVEPLGDLFR